MEAKTSLSRILELSVPALIVFAVSWGIYTTKSNAQEQKINDLETKYEVLLEMKGDIMVIKNDLDYIKKGLDRHLGQE
jgi:hypothetical protein